nr:hypothetical protein [uncultured Niameybacter sp.]
MASRSIKALGCITLVMGTLGGVLSRDENSLGESLSFTYWEEKLSGEEMYSLYTQQRDKLENDIKGKLTNGRIEGMKSLNEGFLYLISDIEEKPLEGGDYSKIKTYYTLTYPKQDEVVLENSSMKKVELKKLEHLYIQQTIPIAYVEHMSKGEREAIESLFKVVFSKDRRFWQTYEEKWLEGFSVWEDFLKQAPLLGDKLRIKEETYREDYGQLINYIFRGEVLIPDWEAMTYEVMSYTTKNNHFFTIKIPVEVLREGDNGLYYNYHYLVGTSENSIVSLKFLRREPLKEKTF